MKRIVMLLFPILLAGGCSEREATQPAPAATAESTLSDSESAGSGRDLSALNVCEAVPADAIAAAVNAQVAGPAEVTDPGFDGKGCRYQYRAGVGGNTRYTEVSVHPPQNFDFQRSMQPFKKTDLPGLGDAAFWGSRSGQTDLYALKNGDISLHVQARGQKVEQAQAIARTVLERL